MTNPSIDPNEIGAGVLACLFIFGLIMLYLTRE